MTKAEIEEELDNLHERLADLEDEKFDLKFMEDWSSLEFVDEEINKLVAEIRTLEKQL